jgi:hypothetical protein
VSVDHADDDAVAALTVGELAEQYGFPDLDQPAPAR